MKSLLLVEDDLSLGQTLTERLEKEGYEVFWRKNLSDAKTVFNSRKLDLIVLDVGLPDGSGFNFAKEVRDQSPIPFIFVTAQTSAEQRLHGYEIGAEEYIPKPFHLKELLLRVKHVLQNHALLPVVDCGDVKIDFASMSILSENGVSERLPKRDFAILQLLIDQAPKVVSRDDILDNVWGEEKFPSNRSIDNIILRLRQALGDSGAEYIQSIRGVGYQWTGRDKTNG